MWFRLLFNLHHRKPQSLCAFEYFDHTGNERCCGNGRESGVISAVMVRVGGGPDGTRFNERAGGPTECTILAVFEVKEGNLGLQGA
jgi:hypothetical protein